MIRAISILVLTLTLVPWSPGALAVGESYRPGTHYTLLDQPVRTRSKDKIEVVELFWYGCGHCYNFEPLIQRWKRGLPDEIGRAHV